MGQSSPPITLSATDPGGAQVEVPVYARSDVQRLGCPNCGGHRFHCTMLAEGAAWESCPCGARFAALPAILGKTNPHPRGDS